MFDMFNTESNPPSSQSVSGSDIFVVSIGGSLIFNENSPDNDKIKQIADVISQMHYSGKKFVLVVGGGRAARQYVDVAKSLGLNNFEQDLLGIHLTRANATLIAAAIPNASKKVLTDVQQAKEIIDEGKIPVFGGLMPLFTTDTVGALIAEYLNATFVNLTNVDGIYDENPNENPDAKRFDDISYKKLVAMIAQVGSSPGQNVVLDLPCCMILQRSKIPAVVLNGTDLSNFAAFVRGEQFIGTVIREIYEEGSDSENAEQDEEMAQDLGKEKKPRKRAVKKKPVVRKSKGGYSAPNPYHIDF